MEKVLKAIISTEKRSFPKDEDLWVEFYTDVPMGIASNLKEDDPESIFALMASMVSDWNFADREGNELEISAEGMRKLPASIANWLAETTKDLIEGNADKKKE